MEEELDGDVCRITLELLVGFNDKCALDGREQSGLAFAVGLPSWDEHKNALTTTRRVSTSSLEFLTTASSLLLTAAESFL